jgi:hypothetical protein
MGECTRAISGQLLSKHVLVARQQILNNAIVGLQQWKSSVFYVVRAEMSQGKDKSVDNQFCTGVCEENT